MVLVSDAPFRNPAVLDAEFVFSFRANGDWVSGAAQTPRHPADDKRPVHMRSAQPAQRSRVPVKVRVEVDGRAHEQVFRPKGWKADGASVGELRVPLSPGSHRVAVAVATSADGAVAPLTWSSTVNAVRRRITVLSYDAGSGFKLEP
jgi:hypothetical protein